MEGCHLWQESPWGRSGASMLKEVVQTVLISVAVAKCDKTRELGERPGAASIAFSGKD